MTKLEDVTQENLDEVKLRLDEAMERLRETAIEVKQERDKYAAVLHRLLREIEGGEATWTWIIDTIKDALSEDR
jgi:hypothetical protein